MFRGRSMFITPLPLSVSPRPSSSPLSPLSLSLTLSFSPSLIMQSKVHIVTQRRWSVGAAAAKAPDVSQADRGPTSPSAASKLGKFRAPPPPHPPPPSCSFRKIMLNVVGPFCLVSMPEESKDPTQGYNMSWTHRL